MIRFRVESHSRTVAISILMISDIVLDSVSPNKCENGLVLTLILPQGNVYRLCADKSEDLTYLYDQVNRECVSKIEIILKEESRCVLVWKSDNSDILNTANCTLVS